MGAAGLSARTASAEDRQAKTASEPREPENVVKNGRIKQSVVSWCFADHWKPERLVEIAAKLGCQSVELIAAEHFPLLKQHGLACAIGSVDLSPDPPFAVGFNNPKHRERVIAATKKAIDECADFGCRRVISFTGYADGLSKEEGAKNCVAGYKQVVGYAEKKGVTLCLEMLNTRDDSHPMKGHPGYQGDNTEYCVEIIKQVGSPALKLLFDVYHVQIMDGDVIRRIHQHQDLIGHVHTAGNPGRGELNAEQEINYPAVMKALVEVGYEGYVGQEFIPTGDPLAGLMEAVRVCDV
jgi:hydroxypyruvate isomerase